MKKIGNFFKCMGISYIYLTVFILSQVFSLFGYMFFKLYTDIDFIEKFVDIFGPIYDNLGDSTIAYLENYGDVMSAYMEIINDLLIPILTISNLCVIIIIYIKIFYDYKKKNIKVIKKVDFKELFKFLGIGILLNLVISLIIGLLPKELIESHEAATQFALNGNIYLLIFSSGILAPIAEELVFRYGMMKNLIKINVPFGIIFQALLFGLMHGNIVQSSYAFLLGLIFGYIDYKHDNIAYSIILHIAINASSVIVGTLGINEVVGMLILIAISFIIYFIIPKKKENI